MKHAQSMLNIYLALAFLVSLMSAPAPWTAIAAPTSTTGVVIAQVYGGGGNTGATYTHDYILLFNASTSTFDLSTWSVQYTYSTSTTSTWSVTELSGSIAPGQFYLIQEAEGKYGTTPLPDPDVIDLTPIAMSATDGKVALVRTQVALVGTPPTITTDIEDLVGYGLANYYEGTAAAPSLNNTTAAWRYFYGCQDTDDNAADFYAAAPQPFNTASPRVLCGEVPAVTAVSPTNLAQEVPANVNLNITFNELVNLTADAVTLECPSGTPVAFTGLPATAVGSVTLDPVSILPPDTICAWRVLATGVTDVDMVAEHPTEDTLYSFSVSEAPIVVSVTPVDGTIDAPLDTNIVITFSEPVTTLGDWFFINCSLSGVHAATVTNTNPIFTLNPSTDFMHGETCSVTIVAANVHDVDTNDPPDTMPANVVIDFSTTSCGGAGTTLISDIQGSSMQLALPGEHTVEAIVVGDYQQGGFNGFFLQEEDTDSDADPTSSEGIFVYYPSAPDVSVGDKVRLTGTASDISSLTQIGGTITGFEICASGNPLPTAATVDLPVEQVNDMERYEGMRVTFVDPLTVVETYQLGRYGQMLLAEGGRIPTYTHDHLPDDNGYAAFLSLVAKRTIRLDDGSSYENPDPVIYPHPELAAANTLRMGDTVASLSGVLDYRYGTYRIQPTGGVDFTHNNPRPTAPVASDGALKVASANVLNYFNTFDVCYNGIGPAAVAGECRGADNAEEFTRQRAKIIAMLADLDADIVGLMEIENDGYGTESALQDLVNGLNTLLGAGTYAFINPDDANGVDALGADYIRVAMLYKPATVTPLGDPAVLNTGAFVQVDDTFTPGDERRNRVPLAQTFTTNATGETLTVVVNHLKSKSSSCEDPTVYLPTGDPDELDGQGNCNLTRQLAAQQEAAWLATDPTGSHDPDFLILGDLNAYALEDPITALKAKEYDYTNLIEKQYGSAAYGYVFDGYYGYLDHALASSSLVSQVAGVRIWHNNADEPLALDYNLENKTADQIDSFYAPDAYRASDHDPVVVWITPKRLVFLPMILR